MEFNYNKIGEDFIMVFDKFGALQTNPKVCVRVFERPEQFEEFCSYYKICKQNQPQKTKIEARELRALENSLKQSAEYKTKFFVGFVDGKPASTATICASEKFCGIFNVSTNFNFQRQGIASTMLQFIIKQNQQKTIFLAVYKKNPAHKLYKKLGFKTLFSTALFAEKIKNK